MSVFKHFVIKLEVVLPFFIRNLMLDIGTTLNSSHFFFFFLNLDALVQIIALLGITGRLESLQVMN